MPVFTRIIHTLLEHGWVKEAGRRNAPGRPVLYETAKTFLERFNPRSLTELPPMPAESEDGGEVRTQVIAFAFSHKVTIREKDCGDE